MKTVAIVMCYHNESMLVQDDLNEYQTDQCFYRLYYSDTPLKELNTKEDADLALPYVLQSVKKAEEEGACAVLIFSFGEVAIQEARSLVSIPVMAMGKVATLMAAELCRNKFTILPGLLIHNNFISDMVKSMGLDSKHQLSDHEVGLAPSEVKQSSDALALLFKAACKEINEHGTDTFTIGCTCFMGLAQPLQKKLRSQYPGRSITVVDPGEAALMVAASL